LCALPALWTGLLYDSSALDAAWDLVKDWTAEERQKLREDVPKLALKAEVRGRSVRDIARDCLEIARRTLDARNIVGCKNLTESRFLDVLDEIQQRNAWMPVWARPRMRACMSSVPS